MDTQEQTNPDHKPPHGKKTLIILAAFLLVGCVVCFMLQHNSQQQQEARHNCYYPTPGQKTEVFNVVVVDMSASMLPIRSGMIDMLNNLLASFRQVATEFADSQTHLLTLSGVNTGVFNDLYFNTPILETDSITAEHFTPWNNTPLVDAIGLSIDWMKAYTDSVQDYAVSLTIITDGFENSSENYSIQQVGDMIRQLNDDPHWSISLLGTDNDVLQQAKRLHIPHSTNMLVDQLGYHGTAENNAHILRSLCHNAQTRKKDIPTFPAGKHLTLEQLRQRKANQIIVSCVEELERDLVENSSAYQAHIFVEDHKVVIALQASTRTIEKLRSADEEQQVLLATFLLRSPSTTCVQLLRALRVGQYSYELRATDSETGEILAITVPSNQL